MASRRRRSPEEPEPAPLDSYREKRSADRTAEPFGAAEPEAGLGAEADWTRPRLFVIQKHAARRLHYDLRLEWDGVLISWAVPQGPSPETSDKRLAVALYARAAQAGVISCFPASILERSRMPLSRAKRCAPLSRISVR